MLINGVTYDAAMSRSPIDKVAVVYSVGASGTRPASFNAWYTLAIHVAVSILCWKKPQEYLLFCKRFSEHHR